MFSLRDLARSYLDYYKRGGVKYSLQNDAAILRAIESILRKQFETPQVLLSHIEAALAQQTRELRESVEWSRSVEQLKEALQRIEDLRQQVGPWQRPARLDEFADGQMRRNPELILLGHLAPYLESNVAIDVGANTGDSTQGLLDAGFTVFAFEPCPAVHQKLVQRFAEQENFTAFDVGIGATDGTSKLKLMEGTTSDSIEVRSLESLQRSRQIPAELGVVKIAAAGNDFHVIQGLGNLRASVIVAEFRSEAHVPTKGETFSSLPKLVREMRARGYKFNLSLYRLRDLEKSHFVSNTLRAPEGASGNVFFFAETSIFEKALNWCGVFL